MYIYIYNYTHIYIYICIQLSIYIYICTHVPVPVGPAPLFSLASTSFKTSGDGAELLRRRLRLSQRPPVRSRCEAGGENSRGETTCYFFSGYEWIEVIKCGQQWVLVFNHG